MPKKILILLKRFRCKRKSTIGNFVEVLTNEDLEKLLNEPPGLLYGDYYLRLNYIEVSQATLSANEGELFNATSIGTATLTNRSFDKKQIIAQNKESVNDENNPAYNPNAAVEELLGDESFSSSNIVLVNEMKWLIDTKDLIFPSTSTYRRPSKSYL